MRSRKREQRGFNAGYRSAFDMPVEERDSIFSYAPYVFGGAMLVAAFAFAGHQMGQNAVAHNLAQDDKWADLVAPSAHPISKGALLPAGLAELRLSTAQEVAEGGKGGFLDSDPMEGLKHDPARKNTVAILAPKPIQLGNAKADGLIIQPAGFTAADEAEEKRKKAVLKHLALAAPAKKIEESFKLKRSEKQKVVAQRRVRLAEENCLARAIYFEARSESELGQLAVAKVILNRTRDPNYPKTICGVVYQGANRSNSCQFSFACDGAPDEPKSKSSWAQAKRVAQKALSGDQAVKVMASATHYHADYVKPRWARSMKRLIKIGRHIFYSDT